jgi:hypothetical protein
MARKINRRKRIQKAAEYADRWLMRKQRRHSNMILTSLRKLQRQIINELTRLETEGGNLVTAQLNLRNAQRIHRDIELLFAQQWEPEMQAMIQEFSQTVDMVIRQFGFLDEEWSGMTQEALQILDSGAWRGFQGLSNTQKNKVIQAVYDQVIAGEEFSVLVQTIEQALLGSKATGVTGRPLAQYAQLYARDALMKYHNEVSIAAAEELEMEHYLYVGDIIKTTRDFCRRRAGKVYTKDQIQSWTHRWSGKSGPAMTDRGGYNCRHHWQPIRPEWLDGEKKINIADWNLEHRQGG